MAQWRKRLPHKHKGPSLSLRTHIKPGPLWKPEGQLAFCSNHKTRRSLVSNKVKNED